MAIQDWEGAMILWGMVSGGGAILGQMKEGSGQVRGTWWNSGAVKLDRTTESRIYNN